MIISSKENPLIKKILSLQDKKFRKICGEFIVESVKAVEECRKSGFEIVSTVCTENLLDKFPNAQVITDSLFERISTEKTPQGVLCTAKIPSNTPFKPSGSCLLLDRIQDSGNLGTIIRTANACGYESVYLIDCADAYSPKTVRASMGGLFCVKLFKGTLEEIKPLISDVQLILADMRGEDVFSFRPQNKICLCIGNEGGGLSQSIIKLPHSTVKIPMRPSCESLNAGVSAAIAMYALKNNQKGEN